MSATLLVRFDDICPTMNWSVWARIEPVLAKHSIKPILTVVPDNRDPGLIVEPARLDFWERVCAWQAAGWSIRLHGFQHRYERGALAFWASMPTASVDALLSPQPFFRGRDREVRA